MSTPGDRIESSPAAPAVDVRGVAKSYGPAPALRGIDLRVERGEALGLLGPNGAGKTTLIRILSTIARHDAGHVRVLGFDPATDAEVIRGRIGVVPQELALYDGLGARENLEFFGRLYGLDAEDLRARVDWALDTAGLADRSRDRVGTFSGGMKRRLNIVASLLHEPELVFLDEPTVGIDPQSRNHVFEMVAGLHARGVTLVYTTHQLGEVERLCDRIVILDTGRAVASGTLADLQLSVPGTGRQRLVFTADERFREAVELLAERGIRPRVEEERPDLEAVFLSLTGRALRDGDA